MLSIQKKFLFVHVPKTGGNSIQNVLKKYSEDEIIFPEKHQDGVERFEIHNSKYNITKHSTISCYKENIERDIYQDLFKFATIRNPWDMCVSYYFSPHRGVVSWNINDFENFIMSIQPITHYIRLKNNNITCNNLQSLAKEPLDLDIDFLMRFENLYEDFSKVCKIINIPYEKLPFRNNSARNHYTCYYNKKLISLVEKRFAGEIEFGKYIYGE